VVNILVFLYVLKVLVERQKRKAPSRARAK
jgi:hypothetical protein